MLTRFATLPEALYAASKVAPTHGYSFYKDNAFQNLSYADLLSQAKGVAGALQAKGIKKGSRVLLPLAVSEEFVCVYYALFLCAAVPCITAPLSRLGSSDETNKSFFALAKQIDASFVICLEADEKLVDKQSLDVIKLECVFGVQAEFVEPVITGSDDALIQASSGSTGEPKAVLLSQQNVLANVHMFGDRLSARPSDVAVTWLPLFHDMGLVGYLLASMYWQIKGCVLLTPYQFLRRPIFWLKTISDFKATLSSGPNFAFALATEKISEAQLEMLDLSSWRAAVCGAEKVDIATLNDFAAKFKACGFSRDAFAPSYGLAEATLCVSMHPHGQPMQVLEVSRKALSKAKLNEPESLQDSLSLVACGSPVMHTEIFILDDKAQPLAENRVGSIWVKSPSIMQVYLNNSAENKLVLQRGLLNTGDMGFLKEGQLFITGRKKELIIIRGHNYVPTDFEAVATELEGVTRDKVIAFGLYSKEAATEQLYIAFERDKKVRSDITDLALANKVKAYVAKQTGVLPYRVEVVAKNTISKTTSGKLQRTKLKQDYQARESKKTAQQAA